MAPRSSGTSQGPGSPRDSVNISDASLPKAKIALTDTSKASTYLSHEVTVHHL